MTKQRTFFETNPAISHLLLENEYKYLIKQASRTL